MLQVARSENPNLYVMAEFFSDSKSSECKYVQMLGINSLVREIQNVIYIYDFLNNMQTNTVD
jgi:hypothetical protein